MHDAVADELRVFQGGDHGEHPLLLGPLQVGLEAHQVVDSAVGIVPAQLYHGKGLPARLWIPQAPGFQGPVAQGLLPPAGHDLHRHTALKDMLVLKAVDLRLLGGAQLGPEGQVLLLGHGAVDIVGGALVVPGGKEGAVHIHALKGDQGGGGVKEVEVMALREELPDGLRQRGGGQRPGGHDHMPLRRDGGDLPLLHGNEGVAANLLGNGLGKAVAIHRQGAPRLHPVPVGTGQDERAHPPQLLLQQPHRVLQLVGAQGVGAHQLPKPGGVVGGGHFFRLHLPQDHGDAPPGQLPGGLRAGQARADDDDRFHRFSFCRLYASLFFLAAVFLAAGFLAVAAFLAVVFLAAVFLAGFFSSSGGVPSAGVSAAVFFL